MPPFGFSDDDVRQAMKDIFGDDGGSGGTPASTSGTNASALGSNQPDGAYYNLFGADGGGNIPGFGLGTNNQAQSPLTNPPLSFGGQVSGQNQPGGSWYQPFSPAGVNSQGQIANGILATPSAAGAGSVGGYSDFSFGGQGGSGLFAQNETPVAAFWTVQPCRIPQIQRMLA